MIASIMNFNTTVVREQQCIILYQIFEPKITITKANILFKFKRPLFHIVNNYFYVSEVIGHH